MFQILMETEKLFKKHDTHLTKKETDEHDFCACPQIYSVESSFRSSAVFCSCPYNYNNAIYKGGSSAPTF